jgi:hypothetical protein
MDVNDLLHAAAVLTPGKSALYPSDKGLVRSWTQSGLCGEQKTLLFLLGMEL